MEPSPQPPPKPSNEFLAQRLKPVWRLLLISNLALGAYIFVRARKKDTGIDNGKTAPEVSPTPIVNASPPIPEEPPLPPPITEPVKMHEPIPIDQQHELFNWILKERIQVKPKDHEEEKRIDEEKAILEHFIHDESIPSL